MKKIICLIYVMPLLFCVLTGYAQKYTKIEDTVKMNKEYVRVNNDIAQLNAKLTIAQNDLPGYQAKAKDANDDAVNAAAASSDQAAQVTGGSVKDAKKAKRKANKAYTEAKDSKAAKDKLSNQQDKITGYKLDIQKKYRRLEELDLMRAAINIKIQTDSLPQLQLQ